MERKGREIEIEKREKDGKKRKKDRKRERWKYRRTGPNICCASPDIYLVNLGERGIHLHSFLKDR